MMNVSRVVKREGCQGSTSQFVTAACLHSIVGDVDLLLWEFGMNDEGHEIHTRKGPIWRHHVTETYVRNALATLQPLGILFANLWSIEIHEAQKKGKRRKCNPAWKADSKKKPDMAWDPLLYMMFNYANFSDMAAVNV